jgi:hypothetical protein
VELNIIDLILAGLVQAAASAIDAIAADPGRWLAITGGFACLFLLGIADRSLRRRRRYR